MVFRASHDGLLFFIGLLDLRHDLLAPGLGPQVPGRAEEAAIGVDPKRDAMHLLVVELDVIMAVSQQLIELANACAKRFRPRLRTFLRPVTNETGVAHVGIKIDVRVIPDVLVPLFAPLLRRNGLDDSALRPVIVLRAVLLPPRASGQTRGLVRVFAVTRDTVVVENRLVLSLPCSLGRA